MGYDLVVPKADTEKHLSGSVNNTMSASLVAPTHPSEKGSCCNWSGKLPYQRKLVQVPARDRKHNVRLKAEWEQAGWVTFSYVRLHDILFIPHFKA